MPGFAFTNKRKQPQPAFYYWVYPPALSGKRPAFKQKIGKQPLVSFKQTQFNINRIKLRKHKLREVTKCNPKLSTEYASSLK